MWRKKDNGLCRGAVVILAANTFIGCMPTIVLAGPFTIDTDEAAYVNLDYYGARTQIGVVKGCNSNGIRSFTGYGAYMDVTDMPSRVEPVQTGDGMTRNLPEDSKKRLYYERQADNESIVLSWDFDISHQLNGVPMEAEKLAGADGLTVIDVVCTSNGKAKDYRENNMLLQVMNLANTEDVSTIVAPGPQTQLSGVYKLILFMVMSGESTTFHVEIGSSNFESSGIIVVMVPGALGQMKEIRDFHEAKDMFSDSAEELVDGLNGMPDKLGGLTNGVAVTKTRLEQLREARAKFDASRDEMTVSMDQGITELAGSTAALTELSPDIEDVHRIMQDISDEIDNLVDMVRGSEDNFAGLGEKLNGLKNDLRDLQGGLQNTDGVTQGKVDKLQAQVDQVQAKLDEIAGGLGVVTSGNMAQAQMAQALGIMKQRALTLTKSPKPYIGKAQVDSMRQELRNVTNATAGGSMDELYELLDKYTEMVGQVQDVIYELQEVLDNNSIGGTSASNAGVLNGLDRVMTDLENVMVGVDMVNSIKKKDQADFGRILDDTMMTFRVLVNSLGNLVNTPTTLQNTLRVNRADVENGMEKALDELIEVTEKAVEDSTTRQVEDANEKMKDNVKNEIDKVEDETNLLNLDVDEQMIFFMLDKSGTPASIQIILKTQEISKDGIMDNVVDIEPPVVSRDIWYRVSQVLVKIWDGIKGISK